MPDYLVIFDYSELASSDAAVGTSPTPTARVTSALQTAKVAHITADTEDDAKAALSVYSPSNSNAYVVPVTENPLATAHSTPTADYFAQTNEKVADETPDETTAEAAPSEAPTEATPAETLAADPQTDHVDPAPSVDESPQPEQTAPSAGPNAFEREAQKLEHELEDDLHRIEQDVESHSHPSNEPTTEGPAPLTQGEDRPA